MARPGDPLRNPAADPASDHHVRNPDTAGGSMLDPACCRGRQPDRGTSHPRDDTTGVRSRHDGGSGVAIGAPCYARSPWRSPRTDTAANRRCLRRGPASARRAHGALRVFAATEAAPRPHNDGRRPACILAPDPPDCAARQRAHSSVVEHRPFKPRVEGSKPSGLTHNSARPHRPEA